MAFVPTSKYPTNVVQTIPARSGVAVPLHKGETIKVINTHGGQVVDLFAIVPTFKSGGATSEAHLSMCQTRAYNLHLTPVPDDTLVDSHRRPLLSFLEDTTPSGIHDTLIAACDLQRYRQLGVAEDVYHESCADNFRAALKRDVDVDWQDPPPDPLNLFMNIPVHPKPSTAAGSRTNADGVVNLTAGADLSFEPPVCRPGDYVTLKALVDCVVVMSACPNDITKINNLDPTEAHFLVETR